MIWFSHVKGPLGTYVRLTYTAILDIGDRESLSILSEAIRRSTSYRVEVLCIDDPDDLYRIALTDPDIVDTLSESGRDDRCVLVVSAQ